MSTVKEKAMKTIGELIPNMRIGELRILYVANYRGDDYNQWVCQQVKAELKKRGSRIVRRNQCFVVEDI